MAAWEAEPLTPPESFMDKFRAIKSYFGKGPKSFLFGSYSYSYLCMPTFLPWKRGGNAAPPFYTVNEHLPLTIAIVMGLQHALAMIGGLIVPPLLIGLLAKNTATQRELINYAMICSGVFTLIHCVQFPMPFGRVYGSGILSCTGISFTFLTNTQSAIRTQMAQGKSFDDAYGACIGTLLVCCWVCAAMGFLPRAAIRRLFPPMVPGVVIFLIGASLIGSAFNNWGGGSACSEPVSKQILCQTPTGPGGSYVNGTCYSADYLPNCFGNGHVSLPFGSPQYLGLGFMCFVILIVLELFGSPMLRNSQIIVALLLGYLIAGLVKYDGKTYVDTTNIKNSPGGTFLWVKTFNISIYGPVVLPYLVGFIVLGVEVIGDVTATAEVSSIQTAGPIHRRRIQGALLADGVNCFFSALAMTLPVTTFAQNNGVINITRCSSRLAGICCGLWLILMGIIAPIGAFFTSIPNCVLGGVTSFLFANVAVSGIKIITLGELSRRTRFILSMAIATGLGTTLVPLWSQEVWPVTPGMSSGTRGFRDACIIVLESGYSIGFLFAVGLHLLLPTEAKNMMHDDMKTGDLKAGLYDPTAPRDAHAYEGESDSPHKAPAVQNVDYRDDTAGRKKGVEMV
jgi:uracil-xanthine permease